MNLNLKLERTTGFDYLRLCLSLAVVLSHTVLSSYGQAAQANASASWIGVPQRLILPMFFALSGFLVAGSLFRCRTLVSFLGLRLIRLIPALAFEVTLSALIFGSLATNLSLSKYLNNREFLNYFLNIFGDIHYTLPGVFIQNPYPNVVNVQLWTIPWELNCYIGLSLMALASLAMRRQIQIYFLISVQIGLVLFAGYKYKSGIPSPNGSSGPILFASFFAGVTIFLNRDRIPWGRNCFFVALATCVVLEMLPYGNFLIAIPSAYMTVWLGTRSPKLIVPLTRGDYSYGIYLYGLPIQQFIASLGPSFQHWYISLAFGMPIAFALSALSWHAVEKPALRLRGRLRRLEDTWLGWRPVIACRKAIAAVEGVGKAQSPPTD